MTQSLKRRFVTALGLVATLTSAGDAQAVCGGGGGRHFGGHHFGGHHRPAYHQPQYHHPQYQQPYYPPARPAYSCHPQPAYRQPQITHIQPNAWQHQPQGQFAQQPLRQAPEQQVAQFPEQQFEQASQPAQQQVTQVQVQRPVGQIQQGVQQPVQQPMQQGVQQPTQQQFAQPAQPQAPAGLDAALPPAVRRSVGSANAGGPVANSVQPGQGNVPNNVPNNAISGGSPPAQAPSDPGANQPGAGPSNPAQLSALQALAGMAPDQQQPVQQDASQAPAQQSAAPAAPTEGASSSTMPDHVGNWTATLPNGAKVRLVLEAQGSFSWTAINGDKTSSFQGTYSIDSGSLTLIRATDSQKLAGSLTRSDNGFNFKLGGEKDAGLNFVRS